MTEKLINLGRREKSAFDAKPAVAYLEDVREMYLAIGGLGWSAIAEAKIHATLQLSGDVLAGIAAEKRTKPVYVISSDTFVETPVIVDYINENLSAVNQHESPAAAVRGPQGCARGIGHFLGESSWPRLSGPFHPISMVY